MLEADLELNRKELSRLVQQEHDYYVIELQKLKGDHSNTMNILMEKNNIQAKEIAELQVVSQFNLYYFPSTITRRLLLLHCVVNLEING